MPNLAISIKAIAINENDGLIDVDCEVATDEGLQTRVNVDVRFARSIAQQNLRIVERVKELVSADFGVTFTGADRVMLFGGAS